jgi:DNA polymerase epsilon subunit 2
MSALRILFEGYANSTIPLAFILIGNFSSKTFIYAGSDSDEYKDNFTALADLIGEFHDLATHSNFVFVPGPKDPWAGKSLPQRPIMPSFVTQMRKKVRKFKFTTNPCRIRYCTQDIVVFREDWLQKLWRNTLLQTNLDVDDDPVKHVSLEIKPAHFFHYLFTKIINSLYGQSLIRDISALCRYQLSLYLGHLIML